MLAPTNQETQVVDATDTRERMFRVSAHITEGAGQAVRARMLYGTHGGTLSLRNLLLPLVAWVPGNVQLYVEPVGPVTAKLVVSVTCKLADGYASPQICRSFHSTPGEILPPSAVRATMRAAGTITVNGVAVVLAANDAIRLTHPAVLTAGSAIAEHEL